MKKKILKLLFFTAILTSLMLLSCNVQAFDYSELVSNYPGYPEIFKHVTELKSLHGGSNGNRIVTFDKDEDSSSIFIQDSDESYPSYWYYDNTGRIIRIEPISTYVGSYDIRHNSDGSFDYIRGVYDNTPEYTHFIFKNNHTIERTNSDGYTYNYIQDNRTVTFDNHGRIMKTESPDGWNTIFVYEDTDLHEAHTFAITPYEGQSTINYDQNTGTKFRFTAVTSPDVEEVSILADKFNGEEWHEITFDYLEDHYKVEEYINKYNQKVWVYEFAINEAGNREFILKINGCRTNKTANINVLPNNGGSFSPTPQQEQIGVSINNSPIEFDVPPQIINDRTMVPLRAIFEALGCEIEWIHEEQKIIAQNSERYIEIVIGQPTMIVQHLWGDGPSGWTYLDSPAVIIDGRTLVPARAVAEAFRCEVEWDESTRSVIITK